MKLKGLATGIALATLLATGCAGTELQNKDRNPKLRAELEATHYYWVSKGSVCECKETCVADGIRFSQLSFFGAASYDINSRSRDAIIRSEMRHKANFLKNLMETQEKEYGNN